VLAYLRNWRLREPERLFSNHETLSDLHYSFDQALEELGLDLSVAYYNLCGNCHTLLDGKNGEEHSPPKENGSPTPPFGSSRLQDPQRGLCCSLRSLPQGASSCSPFQSASQSGGVRPSHPQAFLFCVCHCELYPRF
jgi:hypothetical protein